MRYRKSCLLAVNVVTAMPIKKRYAVLLQRLQPRTQQWRGFHHGRKNATCRANKRFNSQAGHKITDMRRIKILNVRRKPVVGLITCDKGINGLSVRDIESRFTGHQQLAGRGWLLFKYLDCNIKLAQIICRHQASRTCTNDGNDGLFWQVGLVIWHHSKSMLGLYYNYNSRLVKSITNDLYALRPASPVRYPVSHSAVQ